VRFLSRAAFAIFSLPAFGQTSTPAGSYVLQDVRLIDGTGHAPVDHASVVIRRGKITQVINGRSAAKPEGAQVLHLSGKTVIPSLINGHGHLGLVEGTSVSPSNYTGLNIMRQLVQYEDYGVTTIMSLGMNKDLIYRLRSEQEKGNEPGATILTAGRGIGVPNGMPPVKVGSDQLYRPATPEQARAAVREMATRSPDLIKIWVDDSMGKLPKMNPAVYSAVIDEAHRLNLRVAAHVFYLDDAKHLLQAGIDILAHSVRDQELDADTLSLLKSKQVYYIPTLQLEESFYIYADHPDWMNAPFFKNALSGPLDKELDSSSYKNKIGKDPATQAHRKAMQVAMANLKKVHDATAPIGFGTDSGANPYRIPGWAEHRELQLLVQAGLTPMEAIHCATQANAKMLHLDEKTGTIQAGRQADLLVLNADPSKNIANTEKIAMIFHNGRQVNREKK
jgi:imidazolonepropionase-like amidohydrolase